MPISSSSDLELIFRFLRSNTRSVQIPHTTTMTPFSVTDSRGTADWLVYSTSPCHTPIRNVLEYRVSTPEAPEPRANNHPSTTPRNDDEWMLSSSPASSPRSVMGKQNLLIPLLNRSCDDDIPICQSIRPRFKRTRVSPREEFTSASSPSPSEFVIIKPKPLSPIGGHGGGSATKLQPRATRRHQQGGNLFSWEGQFLPISS